MFHSKDFYYLFGNKKFLSTGLFKNLSNVSQIFHLYRNISLLSYFYLNATCTLGVAFETKLFKRSSNSQKDFNQSLRKPTIQEKSREKSKVKGREEKWRPLDREWSRLSIGDKVIAATIGAGGLEGNTKNHRKRQRGWSRLLALFDVYHSSLAPRVQTRRVIAYAKDQWIHGQLQLYAANSLQARYLIPVYLSCRRATWPSTGG